MPCLACLRRASRMEMATTALQLREVSERITSSKKRLVQADSSKRNGYTAHPAKSRRVRPADLRQAVEGDPGAFAVISAQPQETIRQLRAAQGDLVLTRDAVRAVLEHLEAGRITPERAQQWASFVRRGYVAGN